MSKNKLLIQASDIKCLLRQVTRLKRNYRDFFKNKMKK